MRGNATCRSPYPCNDPAPNRCQGLSPSLRVGEESLYLNRQYYLRHFGGCGDYALAMCLAVPMQVVSINGFQCTCEARGIEREVSLFMLQGQEIVPGDHVLVHVGYAIQKVTPDEASESWALFDEILESNA